MTSMTKVQQLGYVGIGSRDVDAWRAYATDVLGHEIAPDSDADRLYLRLDDHHHRLSVGRADEEDVLHVGWDVGSDANLQALAARLEDAGVGVKPGSPEDAADRRVVDLVQFVDPHSSVVTELFYGAEVVFTPPYRPQRAISGYKTGDQGLGHFVTFVADPVAAARFYEEVLGFGVSDWVIVPGMGPIGVFLHCNTRHHSLAVFAHPAPQRRVHHVMMEHREIDDVGTGYDICLERELVTATLGRHLNDRMISYYFKNPGGWHFELGWGAREIDPETWRVEMYNGLQPGGGEWGHKGLLDVM
jgi:2,3-dihydroxybiphenyl 1,2-dioxygenase